MRNDSAEKYFDRFQATLIIYFQSLVIHCLFVLEVMIFLENSSKLIMENLHWRALYHLRGFLFFVSRQITKRAQKRENFRASQLKSDICLFTSES